ncbi:MAG: hypothetical protein ACK5DG_02930 [Chitinophagaceae bacterium]
MHFNFHDKQEYLTKDYFPAKDPVKILITSGASCPDSLVEAVMKKICELRDVKFEEDSLLQQFQ